jgi:MFS family permease
MLSLAKPLKYYQVFLAQGIGMGIGLGLVFVPTVTVSSHYFKRRRSLTAGIVLVGNSFGAIVFPISKCYSLFNQCQLEFMKLVVIKYVEHNWWHP